MVTESGIPVDVVFMTRGELGHADGQAISSEAQSELARQRSLEAIAACRALRIRRCRFSMETTLTFGSNAI